MFDTSKLRGRIIEKYGTISKFAGAANSSMSFISQYLNGHKVLDQKVINKWAEVLDIPVNEYDQYFFTQKVHEMEQIAQ